VKRLAASLKSCALVSFQFKSFRAVAYSICHPVDSYSSAGSVYSTSVVERFTRRVPPTFDFEPLLCEALLAEPANDAATRSPTPIMAVTIESHSFFCM